MWWGAFVPPIFPEDRPLFSETEEKYNGLVDIKACVDPDALFNSGLFTLPPPAKTPKSCKKAKGRKERKGKGMMEEHERYEGLLVASLGWLKIRIRNLVNVVCFTSMPIFATAT